MSAHQATVDEWVERVQAVLKQAEADGVKWAYEADYCEADDCAGGGHGDTPLAATREDGYRQVCIY